MNVSHSSIVLVFSNLNLIVAFQELGFPYDFVELYTGYILKLSSEEREKVRASKSLVCS